MQHRGPVHTTCTPEKLVNGVFTLKTHERFSVRNIPEKFDNTTISGHFGFVFEETSGREIT